MDDFDDKVIRVIRKRPNEQTIIGEYRVIDPRNSSC